MVELSDFWVGQKSIILTEEAAEGRWKFWNKHKKRVCVLKIMV